ncbi:hypothetical protein ACFL42_00990 [Candidatus Omnitrophota bacterium]
MKLTNTELIKGIKINTALTTPPTISMKRNIKHIARHFPNTLKIEGPRATPNTVVINRISADSGIAKTRTQAHPGNACNLEYPQGNNEIKPKER